MNVIETQVEDSLLPETAFEANIEHTIDLENEGVAMHGLKLFRYSLAVFGFAGGLLLGAVACTDGTSENSERPKSTIFVPDVVKSTSTEYRDLVAGPFRFERALLGDSKVTAKPVPQTLVFGAELLDGFSGNYSLHIQNGDATGAHRISSAKIEIDGELVVSASEFSKQTEALDVSVDLQAGSVFEMTIFGEFGSYCEIMLWGELSESTPVIAKLPFDGDVGIDVRRNGYGVSIPAGLVEGTWLLVVEELQPEMVNNELNVEIVGNRLRFHILPLGDATVKTLPSKSLSPLVLVLPVPADLELEEVAALVDLYADEFSLVSSAFVDVTYNAIENAVVITIEYIGEAVEWIVERLQEAFGATLVLAEGGCLAEREPLLVPVSEQAASSEHAIVLIHGFSLFDLCSADGMPSHMLHLANEMKRVERIYENYNIYSYYYSVQSPLDAAGADFANMVAQHFDNSTDLTIVGYSMGGIVARSAMELHELSERVSRLITVGTPHNGTLWGCTDEALLAAISPGMSVLVDQLHFLPQQAASRDDLEWGSPFLTMLNDVVIDRSSYLTYAGEIVDLDCVLYSTIGVFLAACGGLGADGVVRTVDATVEGATTEVYLGLAKPPYVQLPGNYVDHFSLMDNSDILGEIIEAVSLSDGNEPVADWRDSFATFDLSKYLTFGTDQYCAIWDEASEAFQLVYPSGYVGGRLVYDRVMPVGRFTAQFDFRVSGYNDCDGIALVWTPIPDSPVTAGNSLDWNQYAEGYGVEIDFFRHWDANEPPVTDDHIAIDKDGTSNYLSYSAISSGSLDNNIWHTVRVSNDGGHFVVSIDGQSILEYEDAEYSMTEGYFRISATTGTYTGSVWIDNVDIRSFE